MGIQGSIQGKMQSGMDLVVVKFWGKSKCVSGGRSMEWIYGCGGGRGFQFRRVGILQWTWQQILKHTEVNRTHPSICPHLEVCNALWPRSDSSNAPTGSAPQSGCHPLLPSELSLDLRVDPAEVTPCAHPTVAPGLAPTSPCATPSPATVGGRNPWSPCLL